MTMLAGQQLDLLHRPDVQYDTHSMLKVKRQQNYGLPRACHPVQKAANNVISVAVWCHPDAAVPCRWVNGQTTSFMLGFLVHI